MCALRVRSPEWLSYEGHLTCRLCSAGHTESVEAAAFSPIQPLSATASIDGQLLLWDNATLSQRASCSHPEVSVCCSFHISQPDASSLRA